MLRPESIFAILLALSFLFGEAQGFLEIFSSKKIIGYASLHGAEARRLNTHKKPPAGIYAYNTQTQLGPGFYMTNDPDRLPYQKGFWYCAFKADKGVTKRIGKVYIPKNYRSGLLSMPQRLWDESIDVINQYLQTTQLVENPFNALRFSWIKDTPGQMQMAIPGKVLQGDYLKLWGKCFDSKLKLRDFSDRVIDWNDKEEWDIKGDPGPDH
ncbi:hypothetical protein LZ554_000494 [Drepanopeziza brunnea f. sp. 'monogermtubi']|nr:hypothetical protein LZ554_000494 [Drepanopeziza brunnea f. sp. 'monogermtubi']